MVVTPLKTRSLHEMRHSRPPGCRSGDGERGQGPAAPDEGWNSYKRLLKIDPSGGFVATGVPRERAMAAIWQSA